MTNATGDDVVTLVQRDHREIEHLIARVESSAADDRQEAFEDLVRKLAVHETAEEEVVHPLTQRIGAGEVADSILQEESTAKRSLAGLEGTDVTSSEFMTKFDTLKDDVLAHARHEERDEHPRIRADEPHERLERLAKVFGMAERTAPTHAHAAAPESRTGNLVLGPVLAVSDRVRDVLRDAMRS